MVYLLLSGSGHESVHAVHKVPELEKDYPELPDPQRLREEHSGSDCREADPDDGDGVG
jgi:hypothetical protein